MDSARVPQQCSPPMSSRNKSNNVINGKCALPLASCQQCSIHVVTDWFSTRQPKQQHAYSSQYVIQPNRHRYGAASKERGPYQSSGHRGGTMEDQTPGPPYASGSLPHAQPLPLASRFRQIPAPPDGPHWPVHHSQTSSCFLVQQLHWSTLQSTF